MAHEALMAEYLAPMSPLPTSVRPGGTLGKKIHCVLFDIYGTLFISGSGDILASSKVSVQKDKLEHLVTKYGIDKTPQALVTDLHEAIGIEHQRLKNSGIDHPEIKIDQIWQQLLGIENIQQVRKFAVEYELIVNPVYPMPNLKTVLAACRQKNLTMGIISNAQFFTPRLFEWFLEARLEQLGFDPALTFLSYQWGYAKPSLTLFKRVADTVRSKGFETAAVLFVGNDMLNDIYPARRFGFQTALFAGDARSLRLRTDDSRCRNLTADIILTDLKQLIDHITSVDR